MWVLFSTMAVCAHFAGIFFYLIAFEIARDGRPHDHELIPGFGPTTWPERDGLWTITEGGYLNTTSGTAVGSQCVSEYGFFPRWNSTQVVCLRKWIAMVVGGPFFYFDSYLFCHSTESSAFARYFRSLYWAVITMVTIGL